MGKGWILIRQEVEYLVRNVSQDAQDFPVQFFIGKEIGHERAPFGEVGCYKATIDGVDLTPEQIKKADDAAEDTTEFQRFSEVIKLAPDSTVEIRLGFYLRKRSTDSELWQTIDLCSSLDVRVRYDPTEFDLHITPIHPSADFTRSDRDNFGVRVQLNEPLLKGNGVNLWWSPAGQERDIPPLAIASGSEKPKTEIQQGGNASGKSVAKKARSDTK